MEQSSYLRSLGALLLQNRNDEIAKLQKEYARSSAAEDFVQFMDRKIEESVYNRTEIAQRAGLSRDYCFKILRGEKRVTERDYILAICMALGFTLYDTQRALSLYPFPMLDETDQRSALIMAGINNGFSMDVVNDVLENRSFEMIKISPEMPSAKIRPHRSTILQTSDLYSNTERGQEPPERKGDIIMKSEIRVEWEQMGCMPCDMGITAELQTNEFGETVYVCASYTPEGDFYTVSRESYFDEEAFMNSERIEEYDNFRDAMSSKYYKDFIELDKEVDIKVAERKQQ